MWVSNDFYAYVLSENQKKKNPLELYKDFLFSESRRPKEKVKIAALALYLAKAQDLDQKYRAASFVVFAYKCIEENQVLILREHLYAFEELQSFISSLLVFDAPFKGIRDDHRQVYLSLLTVRWHAEILLGISPVNTLIKIDEFSKALVSQGNNITFTQNIGRGLLLYSFYLFSKGDDSEARKVADSLWAYFCASSKLVSSSPMPSSSHLGDFSKLSSYVQHSISGIEWMDGVRKRKEYWGGEKIIKITSRVKLDNQPDFFDRMRCFLGETK